MKARELAEEVGVIITPAQVGPPTWRRIASFRHRDHAICSARSRSRSASITGADARRLRPFDYEREDYFDFRWWPIKEVVASSEQFHPRSLPRLLTGFPEGEKFDEPLAL